MTSWNDKLYKGGNTFGGIGGNGPTPQQYVNSDEGRLRDANAPRDRYGFRLKDGTSDIGGGLPYYKIIGMNNGGAEFKNVAFKEHYNKSDFSGFIGFQGVTLSGSTYTEKDLQNRIAMLKNYSNNVKEKFVSLNNGNLSLKTGVYFITISTSCEWAWINRTSSNLNGYSGIMVSYKDKNDNTKNITSRNRMHNAYLEDCSLSSVVILDKLTDITISLFNTWNTWNMIDVTIIKLS